MQRIVVNAEHYLKGLIPVMGMRQDMKTQAALLHPAPGSNALWRGLVE